MACPRKHSRKIVDPLKPLTTGDQKLFKVQLKTVISTAASKVASKVLNLLYLPPLCQCRLFHDTVEMAGFGAAGMKEAYLPSHRLSHSSALLDPALLQKHFRHSHHQCCLLNQCVGSSTQPSLFCFFPFAGLDPLKHLCSSTSASSCFLLWGGNCAPQEPTDGFRDKAELTCTWLLL